MIPLLLLLALALAAVRFPALGDALAFDRARVNDGEVWRLLTAHLSHDGWSHFLLDAAAVLLLTLACERLARGSANRAAFLAVFLVSFGLLPFSSEVGEYRGLSAIGSALFVCAVMGLRRDARVTNDRARERVATMLSIAFAAKLAFECAAGVSLFAPASIAPPWPLAHAAGALAGLIVAYLPGAGLPTCHVSGSDSQEARKERNSNALRHDLLPCSHVANDNPPPTGMSAATSSIRGDDLGSLGSRSISFASTPEIAS